jgi:hypothetical protein
MKTNILKCPSCDSPLKLRIGYTGADWETEAGEGSGYNYPIMLTCNNDKCARVYTLGHLKGYGVFSQIKENKPYL